MVKGINQAGLVLLEPFLFFCVVLDKRVGADDLQRSPPMWVIPEQCFSSLCMKQVSAGCADSVLPQMGTDWWWSHAAVITWTASVCFIIILLQFCGGNGET